MNHYIISTDATADLWQDYPQEHGLKVASMAYIIDGKEHPFGNHEPDDLSPKQFYDLMRTGKAQPKTSQVTIDTAERMFEEQLKAGNDILHIAFSSALSGSYESAAKAAENLKATYPNNRVVVIDSLCASLGLGLIVNHALTLQKAGKTLSEVENFVRENIPHLLHYFTVDDLHHLRRGGRVSALTAIVGTLLKIKPLLHVDEHGKLISIGKAKGRKKALDWLVDKMQERFNGDITQPIYISHGDCIDDAQYVADQIKQRLGITEVSIGLIGPVIGAHSGPGTVALFFLGSFRKEK